MVKKEIMAMWVKKILVGAVALSLGAIIWVCDLTPPFYATMASAQSLSIEQARASGQVGEMANGLLGVVKPSPAAENLIQSINEKRLEKYRSVAAQQGTLLQNVQIIAGQKLIERLSAGEYFQKDGVWQQR
jgi:uncharacterized protein YdbL (DUF1318 family)